MQKRPFKITLLMLLLLTFISQAMASSLMSYTMIEKHISVDNNSFNKNTTENSALNHHSSALGDINSAEHSKKCCSKNKTCLIFGCATAALIGDLFIQQAIMHSTIKYIPLTVLAFSQQSKSLYRPPILS